MNKTFVRTRNVRNFIGLVEALKSKPKNIPKMGLIYGEPGLGKSQTALWLACKYDGIYIRASNLMTSRWLVEEIVREMDELPRYLTSDNFNVLISKLIQKPKIIFVDEIDYLMNNYKSVETLRDIHDKTDCPIIFVGMGLALRKLERYKHLYDRFSEIVKFETFEIEDLSQIFSQLSEIPFTPDSIEYIHKKYNRFRQIVQLISKLESFAKENNLEEAILALEEALNYNPRCQYVMQELVLLYDKANKHEEAFELIKESLKYAYTKEQLANAYQYIAYFYEKRKCYDIAIVAYLTSDNYRTKPINKDLVNDLVATNGKIEIKNVADIENIFAKYHLQHGISASVIHTINEFIAYAKTMKDDETVLYLLNIAIELTDDSYYKEQRSITQKLLKEKK